MSLEMSARRMLAAEARKTLRNSGRKELAEREGFEPSVEFPLHTLSKRARSTTPPSLRFRINKLRTVSNSVAQNAPSNRTVPRCDLNSVVYGSTGQRHRGNCDTSPNVVRSLTAIRQAGRDPIAPRLAGIDSDSGSRRLKRRTAERVSRSTTSSPSNEHPSPVADRPSQIPQRRRRTAPEAHELSLSSPSHPRPSSTRRGAP